jgi:hypothetical protein
MSVGSKRACMSRLRARHGELRMMQIVQLHLHCPVIAHSDANNASVREALKILVCS